jgi:hypothetical protein
VQVYVDFVQIMLPIMHMPTFQKMLARVRGKSPDVTDVDIFFVLMVLGERRAKSGHVWGCERRFTEPRARCLNLSQQH